MSSLLAPDAIRAIHSLREDHRSSSLTLTRRAIRILRHLPLPDREDVEDLRAVLMEACRRLIEAQPHMAAIVNLANQVAWAVSDQPTSQALKVALRSVLVDFEASLDRAAKAVVGHVTRLLQPGATVLTYSHSSLVRTALLEAAGTVEVSVLLTEARPMGEGVSLAKALARSGLKVTLAVDASLGLLVPLADLILVGADAVTSTWLVHKAGTSLLALAARQEKKLLLALAGSEKLLPDGYPLPPEAPKDPREVLPRAMRGVEVLNLYFDLTPLKLLSGVVTETGVTPVASLQKRIRSNKLHPALIGSN